MKGKRAGKLVLSKETVRKLDARTLDDRELELAAGGAQTNDGICGDLSLMTCRGVCGP